MDKAPMERRAEWKDASGGGCSRRKRARAA